MIQYRCRLILDLFRESGRWFLAQCFLIVTGETPCPLPNPKLPQALAHKKIARGGDEGAVDFGAEEMSEVADVESE